MPGKEPKRLGVAVVVPGLGAGSPHTRLGDGRSGGDRTWLTRSCTIPSPTSPHQL